MIVVTGDEDAMSRPSVVTFGVFDGVHRGHQRLVARVVELARLTGATPSVVTFDPHPTAIISPEHAPHMVISLSQRLEFLARLGVEQVRVVSFNTDTARESAREFVERVIVTQLGATHVVVGDDVHFGRDREGTATLLDELGQVHGFLVESLATVSPPDAGPGERCSSSAVRAALESGDVRQASNLLGRPWVLRGTVVSGDARGREIGFPTANVMVSAGQQIPQLGIYAGGAVIADGQRYPAAISVGRRPHFYVDGDTLVEVHLMDFSGDLYGQEIDVVFLEWLRGEAAFASLEELITQIGRDVTSARSVWEAYVTSGRYDLEI